MAVASSRTQTRFQLVHEPGNWTLTLRTGEVLAVAAHSYAEVEDGYRFVMLMEGTPPFEVEVLRVPRSTVAGIQGG